jgi:hypothetical protein
VITLSETEYDERPIARLDPGWVKGNLGTHTTPALAKFEVIDGNFAAKISTAVPSRIHSEKEG